MRHPALTLAALLATTGPGSLAAQARAPAPGPGSPRERVSLNDGWRFRKGDPPGDTTSLLYEVVLKPWILPTGNAFIRDPHHRHQRPVGNRGGDVAYVQPDFDDSSWRRVDLPHDWAIEGPFDATGGGGMGRLPSAGIGWYRRKLEIPASDAGRSVFLDVDGAMSYASVWLNGRIAGGWPYGYASWRVDLTPYIVPGGVNQLAIRLDNPPRSSRWYPGGGIYRNVWLTKTHPLHVGQWGTWVRTPKVSASSATIALDVTIDNHSRSAATVSVTTRFYELGADGGKGAEAVAGLGPEAVSIAARSSAVVSGTVGIANPKLWGPPPTQRPSRYLAVTDLSQGGELTDRYETRFGIRDVRFDPDRGLLVSGERITLRGANQHHDLGALGAAFNTRAAERQLEMLREMGVNAIRTAHNPPAPELLELTDRMGFLVMDEAFDVWERPKTPLDFHLLVPDWHEQDLRAFVHRDRNRPSVILWSIGNEVGEQYAGEEGAALARRLRDIVREEDPTRPTTAAMNYARPDMPFPKAMDVISLNYQGEGIRDAPEYAGLEGIRTPPLYAAFHAAFPDKLILSAENASALSSRGAYLFPLLGGVSAPVRDGQGGDPAARQVSAYELYTAPFGSSADKVFATLAQNPYVAGGFVWSGWDYLGEPTPYDAARSSYFGVIDLAGFPKDRFWLYQSQWRPELPMAHILPHWTWPERVGQVTPVHVFTSGEAAELFLNGRSLGRKTNGPHQYRLRWDDVVYQPGRLEVVTYRGGAEWARDVVIAAGAPAALDARADRDVIRAEAQDLSFVTVRVVDAQGVLVPRANNRIRFTIEGPGDIVATDSGDPTSLVPFPSHERQAFNGLTLAIVRTRPGETGRITLTAASEGLKPGVAYITVER